MLTQDAFVYSKKKKRVIYKILLQFKMTYFNILKCN